MDFANLRRAWMLGDYKLVGDGMYLGAYTGRYLLFERRSKDSLREPSFSVLAEEFGDISDSVTEAEYWRRQEDSLGEPNYGEGTIAIFDEEGEYVENGSPLFRVGKRVYIFAGFNDDNVPRFGGIIRNIFVDSTARNIQLSVSEEGYRLRTAKTSGDYSSYGTPKLMINQIATEANIADPIYENETGQPTNFQFGYTDLRLRSHWSIIHGSAFCIGYKQIFTEAGRLKLRRSTTFEDLCYPGVKQCWRLGDGYMLGGGKYLGGIYRSKTRPYASPYAYGLVLLLYIPPRYLPPPSI